MVGRLCFYPAPAGDEGSDGAPPPFSGLRYTRILPVLDDATSAIGRGWQVTAPAILSSHYVVS